MIEISIDCVGDSRGPNPVASAQVASLARQLIETYAAELRAPRLADRMAGVLVRDGSELSERIERWAHERASYRRTVTNDVVLFDASNIDREIAATGRGVYPAGVPVGHVCVVVVAGNRATWANITAQPSQAERLLAAVHRALPRLAGKGVEDTIRGLGQHVTPSPFDYAAHVATFGDA